VLFLSNGVARERLVEAARGGTWLIAWRHSGAIGRRLATIAESHLNAPASPASESGDLEKCLIFHVLAPVRGRPGFLLLVCADRSLHPPHGGLTKPGIDFAAGILLLTSW
jgi:hypothetical protein